MMAAHYAKVIVEQVYALPVQRCLEKHIRLLDLQAGEGHGEYPLISTSSVNQGAPRFDSKSTADTMQRLKLQLRVWFLTSRAKSEKDTCRRCFKDFFLV